MFTILHISDLHRSPDDPVSNAELISSLLADRDHYAAEEPCIGPPEAIVVSGDLIHGASLDHPGPKNEIENQYETALEFLSALTDRFLFGDRSRVIIVPGNHDVDWNTALTGLKRVRPENLPPNLLNALVRPDSLLRWDWRTQRVFEVVDVGAYEGRFTAYWTFFQEFYGTLGDDQTPQRYFTLHELHDGRIGVAAFNSCFGNDCFSRQGVIPEHALAQSHLDLHDKAKGYEVLMAVWHHSVEGPPLRTDYLDIGTVDRLIGKGFRVGLHGHQHRADATARSINRPSGESMVVISAGSLCAGAKELPRGVNRQYNVIELGDDLCSAKIHVREQAVATVFGPARLQSFGGASYYEMEWRPPPPMLRGIDVVERRITDGIMNAEEQLSAGNAKEAVTTLAQTGSRLPPHGRRLLLRALEEANDQGLIVELLSQPRDVTELVMLIGAHIKSERFDEARQSIEKCGGQVGMSTSLRDELLRKIRAEEVISHGD